MGKASTEMLEQGTQTPFPSPGKKATRKPIPAPRLIPAEEGRRNLTGNSNSGLVHRRRAPHHQRHRPRARVRETPVNLR